MPEFTCSRWVKSMVNDCRSSSGRRLVWIISSRSSSGEETLHGIALSASDGAVLLAAAKERLVSRRMDAAVWMVVPGLLLGETAWREAGDSPINGNFIRGVAEFPSGSLVLEHIRP